MWRELAQGSPEIFDHCVEQTLWNTVREREMIKMPTKTKAGVICLLQFKRMSDFTNRYVVRAKRETEEQYDSLRSALSKTMQRPGQISIIAGARSLNEEELKKIPGILQVPKGQHRVHQIQTKYTEGYVQYTI